MGTKANQRVSSAKDDKNRKLIVQGKYEAAHKAILAMLPIDGEGVTRAKLTEMIAPLLPKSLFRHIGTVRWYTRLFS